MLRAAWGWARGCLLPRSIPGGCRSRRRRSLKAHGPRRGGCEVFPEAGLSSWTGRAGTGIAAGLPGIVFQPPERSLRRQPMQSAAPSPRPRRKPRCGSGVHQLESRRLHCSTHLAADPGGKRTSRIPEPPKTPEQAELCCSSSPASHLPCLPPFPLLHLKFPILRRAKGSLCPLPDTFPPGCSWLWVEENKNPTSASPFPIKD